MRMDEKFLRAVETVLKHEGGYVNDPRDPGGETKYGISKRSYPSLDIANLTREQAVAIYKRDWWDRYGYGRIEDAAVATKVFDMSVNMGPATAHKILQKALNFLGHTLVVDGILGTKTLDAVNRTDPARLLQALKWHCAEHYYRLAESSPSNRTFLFGWLRRAYGG